MSTVYQVSFPSHTEATAAAGRLVAQGIASNCIEIDAEGESEVTGNPTALGLNLGSGIYPDAINALLEQHESDTEGVEFEKRYVVSVDTQGDALNERIAREALSDGRPYLA